MEKMMLQNVTELVHAADVNVSNTTDKRIDISNIHTYIVGFRNSLVLVCSCVTLLCLLGALLILYKCKTMFHQMKTLAYSVLLSDVAIHATFCARSIYILVETDGSPFYAVAVTAATFFLTSTASLAGLSLDRIVAMIKPMEYHSIMTKQVLKYVTVYIWLAHTVVPIAFTISLGYVCNWEINSTSCKPASLLLAPGLIVASFIVIYNSFIVISYVVIIKKLRLLRSSVATLQHIAITQGYQNATDNILRILLVFEVANLTILAMVLFFVFDAGHTIQLLSPTIYVCLCVNSYICMYMYVLKMKECRMILMRQFSPWFRRFKRRSDQQMVDIDGVDGVASGGNLPSMDIDLPLVCAGTLPPESVDLLPVRADMTPLGTDLTSIHTDLLPIGTELSPEHAGLPPIQS